MIKVENYRIFYKIITIIILIVLIISAVFFQLRLAGEGDNLVEANQLQGQIVASSDQSLSLRDNKNVTYSIDLKDAKITGDQIQFGNQVTVEYTGALNQGVSVQDIDVLKVSVQAKQVRNGGIANIDSTIASPQIASKVANMSLEQKVAQMFLAICPEKDALELLNKYQIGGYILENKDFKNKSRKSVITNIQSYQDAVSIPLLIMVNEEGGSEVCVSNNLRNNRFQLPQDVFKAGGIDAIVADTTEKSEFLKEFGINVNMGPVVDLPSSADDFIYKRSFGVDVSETSEYVKSVIGAMNSLKMGSVLKHFPGYGNAPDNKDIIYHDTRGQDSFINNDFIPFKAGINAGANCILINHNIVDAFDNQNPASMSSNVIKILRGDLNYNGVIIADDIAKAVPMAFGSSDEVAKKCVQAGNDMITTSNPKEHISAVIAAAKNNEFILNDLDQSVMRILTWKSQLGLI